MTNSIYPISGSTELAKADKGAWTISFANWLDEGQVLASGTSVLVRTVPPMIDTVSGFVTSTTLGTDTQTLVVAWSAANLVRGERYELQVNGVVSSTNKMTLIVPVECRA